jgi:hypothetical protein
LESQQPYHAEAQGSRWYLGKANTREIWGGGISLFQYFNLIKEKNVGILRLKRANNI